MTIIEAAAQEFNISPSELLNQSIKSYLNQKLFKTESELFLLTKKYGVTDIVDFDQKVKTGFINEQNGFDDFFKFDHLEHERQKIKEFLNQI